MTHPEPVLRPVTEADLPQLDRLMTEPAALGQDWGGFGDVRSLHRELDATGLLGESGMLVVDVAGECVGQVGWRPASQTRWHSCLALGASVFPEHRGRGYGWRAQRQLVDYLFATSPVHRIEARTRVDNVAEQRALEKAGLQREGVSRGLLFRDGQWRDMVVYSALRTDPRPTGGLDPVS